MKNKYSELLASINNKPRNYNSNILIFDGLNTFLRSFCMVNTINPQGAHIGGLIGFLKSIGYAIKITSPTRVIILFDGVGGSSARKNLYPDYKANRHISRMTNYGIFSSKDEEDDSIKDQMERLIQYLQCLPLSLLSIDGLEADDIIGYMATHFETLDECEKVTIVSADRDFLQLASNKTEIYSPVKRLFYNKRRILEEYNVSAQNFLTQKILLGDTGDNIPGVTGLGPKKLIKYFPELAQDVNFGLVEVLAKAEASEEVMYKKVLERKHQLEINEKIMDLKHIPLSDFNRETIHDVIDSYPTLLNQHGFLTLYYKDQLAESISYVERWISETFGFLSTFK